MMEFLCALSFFAIVLAVSVPTKAQQSIGDRLASDIQAHAASGSNGQCAKAVRESIERVTGLSLQRTQHAKNYGPSLQAAGFSSISNGTPLLPGDVRIIQPARGHPSEHIQIYTGNGWASDFKQRDQWPGSAYRKQQPSYTTYRLQD